MYRLADKNDIEKLCGLRVAQQKESWGSDYLDNGENLFEMTKIYMEKHLNDGFFVFAREVEGEIVATCGVEIFDYLPQCVDKTGITAFVVNIYTKTEFRKQGIQKELLVKIMEFAKKQGAENIALTSNNPAVRKMYKKSGFLESTCRLFRAL